MGRSIFARMVAYTVSLYGFWSIVLVNGGLFPAFRSNPWTWEITWASIVAILITLGFWTTDRLEGLLIDDRGVVSIVRLQLLLWMSLSLSIVISFSAHAFRGPSPYLGLQLGPDLLIATGISLGAFAIASLLGSPRPGTEPGRDDRPGRLSDLVCTPSVNSRHGPWLVVDASKLQLLAVTLVVISTYAVSVGANLLRDAWLIPPIHTAVLGLLVLSNIVFLVHGAATRLQSGSAEAPPFQSAPSALKALEPLTLREIRPTMPDAEGRLVTMIFARNAPFYAVYEADGFVLVHFADDPKIAQDQRVKLAAVATLRSEIDSLIGQGLTDDGAEARNWFGAISSWETVSPVARAQFRRRLAGALHMALQSSVVDAVPLLERLRDDLLDRRRGAEHVRAILAAGAMALGICGINAVSYFELTQIIGSASTPLVTRYLLAGAAGALGAFVSIAYGPLLRSASHAVTGAGRILDIILRVTLGSLIALILQALANSAILTLGFGNLILAGAQATPSWSAVIGISLLAGFAERLLPTMFRRATASIAAAPPAILSVAGTSAALADVRHAVKESFNESVSGSELVRYDGYVDLECVWLAHDQGKARLSLRFLMQGAEGRVRLAIGDGIDRPTADFLVIAEPEDSVRDAVRTTCTVPTNSDSEILTIDMTMPELTETVWVKIQQGYRIIQVVEVALQDSRSI